MHTSLNKKVFFVGVNTGFAVDKAPDGRCIEFYTLRSGHGLHCSIVGNVLVPGGIGPNDQTAEISKAPAWRLLSEAIASKGAVPGIQLATVWSGYAGRRNFVSRSTSEEIANCRRIAAGVSSGDIRQLFRALREGTELAIDAGFRHVQVHAAHGYLFSLLVDRRIYPNSQVVLDGLSDWATRLNSLRVESSIRFSLRTGDQSFDEAVGRSKFLDKVASLPVDYLDASSGFYDINKRLIYPSVATILTERVSETVSLAERHSQKQFIYSGKSTVLLEANLPANVHIGLCRHLIANPNYLRDRQDGCVNMMKCHWYSRGDKSLRCGRWQKQVGS